MVLQDAPSFTARFLVSCQFLLKIPHCTGRKIPTPELLEWAKEDRSPVPVAFDGSEKSVFPTPGDPTLRLNDSLRTEWSTRIAGPLETVPLAYRLDNVAPCRLFGYRASRSTLVNKKFFKSRRLMVTGLLAKTHCMKTLGGMSWRDS